MNLAQKILMLGGSAQQVIAIKLAKLLGYQTILVDYLSDNPGQFVADKWYEASTTDVEAVCKIAEIEQVSGILAYASDPAALPAAIVAERLGLPTNPSKSVEILGVKHKFREFLKDNGFAFPKNVTLPADLTVEDVKDRISNLSFPIVIKPTDSSGSKGISFLNCYDNLEQSLKHANEYSRNKIFIAEEFIERGVPFIVGGDVFVLDGKIVLKGDMACLRDNGGKSLIPIGKMKPAGLTELQRDNLYSELQHLMDVLDIKFGEFNIEVIIDSQNKPHFLEVGPRAGGNMIPIQLSDAFGVDLIKANICAAMGMPFELNPIEPKDCFMSYVLHSHKDGVFKDIYIDNKVEKYIYRKAIYKRNGDKVEFFDGAGKALGIVFMRFPTKEIMIKIKESIDSLIKVELE